MKTGRRQTPIDWPAIRRRLGDAQRLVDETFAPPPERRRAILEARARALAQEPATPPARGFEALTFELAEEHYAVETAWVSDVYPLRELTPLPGTPPFVLGIIHARGRIVSVLDLKNFFELPATGLSDLNKVIVLSDGSMEFGILADRIGGVRNIPDADLQPALPTLTGIRAGYLRGLTQQREVVLDAGRLLADQRIVVDTGAEE